jgi:hypothetical protein
MLEPERIVRALMMTLAVTVAYTFIYVCAAMAECLRLLRALTQ